MQGGGPRRPAHIIRPIPVSTVSWWGIGGFLLPKTVLRIVMATSHLKDEVEGATIMGHAASAQFLNGTRAWGYLMEPELPPLPRVFAQRQAQRTCALAVFVPAYAGMYSSQYRSSRESISTASRSIARRASTTSADRPIVCSTYEFPCRSRSPYLPWKTE
jgi:hypothetical protein